MNTASGSSLNLLDDPPNTSYVRSIAARARGVAHMTNRNRRKFLKAAAALSVSPPDAIRARAQTSGSRRKRPHGGPGEPKPLAQDLRELPGEHDVAIPLTHAPLDMDHRTLHAQFDALPRRRFCASIRRSAGARSRAQVFLFRIAERLPLSQPTHKARQTTVTPEFGSSQLASVAIGGSFKIRGSWMRCRMCRRPTLEFRHIKWMAIESDWRLSIGRELFRVNKQITFPCRGFLNRNDGSGGAKAVGPLFRRAKMRLRYVPTDDVKPLIKHL